jgi:hypothetical protein
VALVCALAGPAYAADNLTVNTTSAYVDPSVAAEFVTTPNLCTEPIGSQGTNPLGCGELGLRAVTAYQGNSTTGDVYWEPAGSQLQATNAFVPSNPGSTVGATGYAPIFSQHKYDLFGRSGDTMGPYTREEHLFLIAINFVTTGGGITNGQTTPGEDTLLKFVSVILAQNQGVTSFSQGGYTFNIADLPTYQRITGFTSGQWTTVRNWCVGYPFPAAFCDADRVQTASLYLELNGYAVAPSSCGPLGAADCGNRDEWVDQAVVGYVEAWGSLGGDGHFAQNFRSQVGYDPTAAILDASTSVIADFRLEQSVELSGAFTTEATDPGDALTPGDNMDGIAGRQTFQQAITTESTADFGFLYNQANGPSIGQLVSQDVNGYFFSCLNCNNAAGNDHTFTPVKLDLAFMPYQSGWDVVPTVIHGGQ